MQVARHWVLPQRFFCKRLFQTGLNVSSASAGNESNRKNAISSGPGLEDFVEGSVADEDKWSNYTGQLIKEKGIKRLATHCHFR